MPCVVVIEPDTRQAAVIKRIVRDRARAELVLVDSKDAALAAIHRRVPDLILATTLMAPRDGAALAAYLRDLPGATHLQILTIPLLAPAEPRKTARRGLLKSLKRTPDAPLSAGCDPEVFGDEVEAYLKRASELREDHEKVVTQRSNMERRGKTKIERVIVPSEPPEPIPPTLRKAVEPAPFAGPRRIEPPVVPAPEMVEAGANRTVAIAETQTSPDRDSVQDAAPDVDSLAPVETPASETGESSTSEPDAAATRRVASFDAAEPLKAGVEAESEVSLAAPEPGVVDQPPSSNVASQDELPVIVAGPAPVLSAEPEVVSDLVGDAAKDPVEESVPEPLTIAEGSFPGVEEISAAPVETPPTNERRLEVAPVADETSIAGDLATPAGGPATIEDVGSPAPPEPKGVDELVVEPVNIGEPIIEMLTPDESAANVAVHEVAGETVQVGEQIAEGASGGES
ncbi:MAG: hypothetical protein HYX76_16315, partial [Acidobacteria bacterium]|nr:hypothetical protein [Acidobacteriota bacterium]